MISIDKFITPKDDISLLILCNRENISNIPPALLDRKQAEYINCQLQENDREFFCFDLLSRKVIVNIIKEKELEYQTVEQYRRCGGKMLEFCDREFIKDLQVYALTGKDNLMGFAEGMMLNSYVFDNYKTDPKRCVHPFDNLHLITNEVSQQEITAMTVTAEAIEKCRDLVNEPVTVVNAETMAQTFSAMAQEAGIRCEIWHKDRIEKEKMGGILAVNRGSVDAPTFTIMEYKPEKHNNSKPIVLVGKGIVYDTGGLNIKPGDFMEDMKDDMAGAATMACTVYAAARLNLPVHIIALMPATDNRPNGNAYASGDIINMYDGTTVEVVNTDAEGRMILADALAYAKHFTPSLVIDAATLTGAAVRAIGTLGIAAVENRAENFMEAMKSAGKRTYERIAELPFWEEYDEMIVSDIADIKNSGEKYAGTITAGKFLAHFTSYPYIHLDIAGVAFNEKKDFYRAKGGTGYGIRLILDFLQNYYK